VRGDQFVSQRQYGAEPNLGEEKSGAQVSRKEDEAAWALRKVRPDWRMDGPHLASWIWWIHPGGRSGRHPRSHPGLPSKKG